MRYMRHRYIQRLLSFVANVVLGATADPLSKSGGELATTMSSVRTNFPSSISTAGQTHNIWIRTCLLSRPPVALELIPSLRSDHHPLSPRYKRRCHHAQSSELLSVSPFSHALGRQGPIFLSISRRLDEGVDSSANHSHLRFSTAIRLPITVKVRYMPLSSHHFLLPSISAAPSLCILLTSKPRYFKRATILARHVLTSKPSREVKVSTIV